MKERKTAVPQALVSPFGELHLTFPCKFNKNPETAALMSGIMAPERPAPSPHRSVDVEKAGDSEN